MCHVWYGWDTMYDVCAHLFPLGLTNVARQYHLLDVCHTHLFNTRGPPAEGVSRPLQNQQAMAPTPSGSGANNVPFNQGPAIPSGGTLADKVLAAIENMKAGSEHGVSVNDIAARLGVPVFDIKKTVETLSMDGHLYSTIDEEHYTS